MESETKAVIILEFAGGQSIIGPFLNEAEAAAFGDKHLKDKYEWITQELYSTEDLLESDLFEQE